MSDQGSQDADGGGAARSASMQSSENDSYNEPARQMSVTSDEVNYLVFRYELCN